MKRFIEFQYEHVEQLLSWFSSQSELTQWAGPGFSFPLDQEALLDKLERGSNSALTSSFSLLESEELIAFGQFYSRSGCAHLCRLAVSPAHRGEGVIAEVVLQLLVVAESQLSTSKASLLVYPDNLSAIRSYQKLGFKAVDCPDNEFVDGCLYMQRPITVAS